MNSKIELPSAKSVISTAASVAATAMLVRSVAKDFIPHELTHYFYSKAQYLLTMFFTNDITLVIDEFDGLVKNQLFHAAKLYIGTITGPSNRIFRASLPEKENVIQVSVGGNEVVTDQFRGSQLIWRLVTVSTDQPRHVRGGPDEYGSNMTYEVRYLELTFHKKHKNTVMDEYLPYVLERSRAVKEEKKTLKLYTLRDESRVYVHGKSPWEAVNLDHPANFETLAMDGEMKSRVMDDLDMFVKRRELYRKVGKAWKRGYLLFGPPGTGKSSLVAAMANYLKFDVYDLELTSLRCNSDLRRLLISTGNRSILVVEDIDASIDLSDRDSKNPPPVMYHYRHDQGPKVTLSGLLNFIDGLWSSCGDERIIVFTTNHKEKLDPALLRPGRMDVHIHMSYCTPCGFKLLATNYLGAITENNPLVAEVELLIASTKVTPAEIGEQLLRSHDPDIALKGLIKFLDHKNETEKETSDNTTNHGLKELLKKAKATNDDDNKILKKDEAANNALKVLIGFLENEIGTEEVNDSDSSSVATEIEIENDQNGTKSE